MWKAPVDFVVHGPDFSNVAQLVGSTMFGILGHGGGLFRVGNQIFRIPLVSPYRDIVAGMLENRIPSNISILRGNTPQIAEAVLEPQPIMGALPLGKSCA